MKRWKEGLAVLMALALCAIGLSACAPQEGEENESTTGTEMALASPYEVTAVPLEDPWEHALEKDSKVPYLNFAAQDFAFRLSAVLVQDVGEENFICSPYSVWLPLAALANGAEGEVQRQLLSALCGPDASVEELNQTASRMLFELTGERQKSWQLEEGAPFVNPLRISNLVLVQRELRLEDAFVQTLADSYLGQAMGVDFADAETVRLINDWAAEQTGGLITDLVDEFDPNTTLTIANAIYFADRWIDEFDPAQTREDVFYAPAGESQVQYMYCSEDGLSYYENESFQVIRLPFASSQAGLYILLPKDGDAVKLLEYMDWEQFWDVVYGMEGQTGTLLLPKFRIDGGPVNLQDALEALDVPLFDSRRNPLGGLVGEDVPLWLIGAVQNAMIEVDEKGTTAAAVTLMDMGAGGPLETPPFEMICNRPFVFILSQGTYDGGQQILFTGVVNDPSQ